MTDLEKKWRGIINNALDQIHKYRSIVGYSSAIIGIELFINDLRSEQYKVAAADFDKLVEAYQSDCEDVKIKEANAKRLNDAKSKIDFLSKKIRLSLAYYDDKKEAEKQGAVCFLETDCGHYIEDIILLPSSWQNAVFTKVNSLTAAWDDDMIANKTKLRVKTSHELGHIIEKWYDGEKFVCNKNVTEEFAELFAVMLAQNDILGWCRGIPTPLCTETLDVS